MWRMILLVAGLLCPAIGAAGATPPPTPKPIQIAFQQIKLKNGLRVILSEDHSAPTYSICVTYNAGSRDERPGRTGFAHLFEHMMFQGSENVGKGEHFILIENTGGSMNGTTDADRTTYFQTLPANQLDLGLFLEADRMRSLAINQANLDNQRNAVQEERRLRVDNQPYGKTFEAITETAYDNFAYKHSTIGSMADLDAAAVGDVLEFFKIYYAPNNAVLTLVGDFTSDQAISKVKQYFESIPQQSAPPVPDMTEPEQNGDAAALLPKLKQWLGPWRRSDLRVELPSPPKPAAAKKVYLVDRTNSVQTTAAMGNIAIDRRDPDYIPLVVMNRVLGDGPAARLFIKLREEKGYTYGAYSSIRALKYPGPWRAGGDVRTEVTDAAFGEFLSEIRRMREEKVTEAELEECKRSVVAAFALSLEQPTELLSYAITRTTYGFPADYWDTYPAQVSAVTAEDVQRVARKYLDLETLQIVAVGDASNVRAVVEKYGPVEVYDVEGSRKGKTIGPRPGRR